MFNQASVLLFWWLFVNFSESLQRYDDLVFEGGGVRGVSYVGALQAFERQGYYANRAYAFENIVGTSIGCVFGLAVALDISPTDMETLVYETDFTNLFDPTIKSLLEFPSYTESYTLLSKFQYMYRWMVYLYRVFRIWIEHSPVYGISDDARFAIWLQTKVLPLSVYANRLSINSTLTDLYHVTNHTLTCYATRVYDVGIVRMDITNSPSLTLRDTVYSSASLPVIFQPKFDNNGFPLVDGSLLLNFPIYNSEDRNVLGLSLNTPIYDTDHLEENSCVRPNPKNSFVSNLMIGVMNFLYKPKVYNVKGQKIKSSDAVRSNVNYLKNLMNLVIHDREWLLYSSDPLNCDRVIYLNSSLQVLELSAPKEKIKQSIVTAYRNTKRFFNHKESLVCNCLAYIEHKQRYV